MKRESNMGTLIVGLVLLFGGLFVLFTQPYWEARAFNKFTTGPKASYWDAVWTELRVMPK